MRTLKVCFVGVSHSFPQYRGENTRVLQLANNLSDLGVEVHLIVPRIGAHKNLLPSKDSCCEAIIHEVRTNLRFQGFDYVSSLAPQLKYLLGLQKDERFDLVHAHMFWGGPLGLAVRKLGIPVVFDPHDWFFCDLYGFPFVCSDLAEICCSKVLDATLVTGRKLRQYLISRGISEEKLHSISNGVDKTILDYPFLNEANTTEIRRIVGTDGSERIVVFLGALLHYQGVDILVRAFKNVLRKNPARLIIVGDGPDLGCLMSLARQLQVSKNVYFGRNVPWPYLIAMLDISDVAVIPFRRNRYTEWIQPIKVFEYFARRKPVIASNLQGVSEIVEDGVNGSLVCPEKIDDLSASIVALLDNETHRRKMGEKGRELVKERYQWSNVSRSLLEVYRVVLSQKRSMNE